MYLRTISIFKKNKDAQGNIKRDQRIVCFMSLIPHISFIGSVTLGSYIYSTYTIKYVYIHYAEQGSLEALILEACINQQISGKDPEG